MKSHCKSKYLYITIPPTTKNTYQYLYISGSIWWWFDSKGHLDILFSEVTGICVKFVSAYTVSSNTEYYVTYFCKS